MSSDSQDQKVKEAVEIEEGATPGTACNTPATNVREETFSYFLKVAESKEIAQIRKSTTVKNSVRKLVKVSTPKKMRLLEIMNLDKIKKYRAFRKAFVKKIKKN